MQKTSTKQIIQIAKRAREASFQLASLSASQKNNGIARFQTKPNAIAGHIRS